MTNHNFVPALYLDPAVKPRRVGNRPRGKEYYPSCRVMRRFVERRLVMNFITSEVSDPGGKPTVVVRACGSPLFDDDGRASGVCRSCARGWQVDENYPVDAAGARIFG